ALVHSVHGEHIGVTDAREAPRFIEQLAVALGVAAQGPPQLERHLDLKGRIERPVDLPEATLTDLLENPQRPPGGGLGVRGLLARAGALGFAARGEPHVTVDPRDLFEHPQRLERVREVGTRSLLQPPVHGAPVGHRLDGALQLVALVWSHPDRPMRSFIIVASRSIPRTTTIRAAFALGLSSASAICSYVNPSSRRRITASRC